MKRPHKAKSPSRSKADLSLPQYFQKIQAFGKLMGGVAHDFNNLLTIFQGYTELLQLETDPLDSRQEYLREMASAVERARRLTAQLLNFSHRKRGAPEAIRLGVLLLDDQKMLRRMIPENIELILAVEETTGDWVLADPREIEALLVTLLIRACEAMPKGGRIAIERVETATEVQVIVSHSGAGRKKPIPLSAKPEEEGLAVCLQIVEQMGGQMTSEDVPGEGSAFRISLPRLKPPKLKKAASAAPALPCGNGEEILVVEDDVPVRKVLASMIESLGYRVFCASHGEEALRVLKKERKIRLVISDLVMPIMGGIELASEIRQHGPDVGIIFTSGYTFESFGNIDLIPSPVFLPKPIPPSLLATLLCEHLHSCPCDITHGRRS